MNSNSVAIVGASGYSGEELVRLSQKLVTLRDDAPVELDLATAKLGGFDRAAAVRIFQELGFNGLARRLPEW